VAAERAAEETWRQYNEQMITPESVNTIIDFIVSTVRA
jgi:hypothetical protein